MDSKLRPMTQVTWDIDTYSNEDQHTYRKTFGRGPFLFVGEILNMPGHGFFIDMNKGKNLTGLHIENFKEWQEE